MKKDTLIVLLILDLMAIGMILLFLFNASHVFEFLPWYKSKSMFDIAFDVYFLILPGIFILGIAKCCILLFSGVVRQGVLDLLLGSFFLFITEFIGIETIDSGSRFPFWGGIVLFLWVIWGITKNILEWFARMDENKISR